MITEENLTGEELVRHLRELEDLIDDLQQRVYYLENPDKKDLPDRPPINERLET